MNAADRLIQAIKATGNPTVMGLDTQLSHLPKEFAVADASDNAAACAAILRYNAALLELMQGLIPCVKVQVAYYEQLGLHGMYAFAQTLRMAREKGYITIADAKRNDIGATSEAYARAYLAPGADFEADFLTVNGYLGIDGVKPFLELCKENKKGMFILVKTSNPSSGQIQDMPCGDKTVYEAMAQLVAEWGEPLIGASGYSPVGAVVGATYPDQSTQLRGRMPHSLFLVPGYGAQGATGADLRGCFGPDGFGAVVNASRSLLAAHQKAPELPWREAAKAEAVRMREDIAPRG